MDRRFLKLNRNYPQNKFSFAVIQITGSGLVNGTLGTGGVTIGADFCTAKDDGSNAVTIEFNVAQARAPLVWAVARGADTVVQTVVPSTTGLTYITVENDSTGAAKADANVDLLLIFPEGLVAR